MCGDGLSAFATHVFSQLSQASRLKRGIAIPGLDIERRLGKREVNTLHRALLTAFDLGFDVHFEKGSVRKVSRHLRKAYERVHSMYCIVMQSWLCATSPDRFNERRDEKPSVSLLELRLCVPAGSGWIGRLFAFASGSVMDDHATDDSSQTQDAKIVYLPVCELCIQLDMNESGSDAARATRSLARAEDCLTACAVRPRGLASLIAKPLTVHERLAEADVVAESDSRWWT